MPLATTGTATFHYLVITDTEDGYELTGYYHDEETVYETPNLTIGGVDADIDGMLTMTADENEPGEWMIVEAFEDRIDVRTE